MALQVVLAEDSYVVREGVQRLLERDREIDVVAVCADGEATLQAVERTDPDVVVTDIRMPPHHLDEGIELAARLRLERPEIGVVVLSQYDDPEYAVRLLDQGAAGRAYLLKERLSEAGQLTSAIKQVAAGSSLTDSATRPLRHDFTYRCGSWRSMSGPSFPNWVSAKRRRFTAASRLF